MKFIDGPQGRLVSADDTGNVRIWRREGTKACSFTVNMFNHVLKFYTVPACHLFVEPVQIYSERESTFEIDICTWISRRMFGDRGFRFFNQGVATGS